MKAKKITSKIIALLTAIVMTLVMLPAMAFAEEAGKSTSVVFAFAPPEVLVKGAATDFVAYASGPAAYPPEYAYSKDAAKGKVTCESNNTGVIAVGEITEHKRQGFTIPITAVGEGKATLTVTAADTSGDDAVSKTCEIEVIEDLITVIYNGTPTPINQADWNSLEPVTIDKLTNRNHSYTFKDEYVELKGRKLEDILSKGDVDVEALSDDQVITFMPTDGEEKRADLTVKELLRTKRYYFPNVVETSVPEGAAATPDLLGDAVEITPIICDMDDNNARMAVGQVAPNERCNSIMVKNMSIGGKIIISDANKASKLSCDVQANKASGSKVAPGTEIVLSSATIEDTDIYYTTDGSEPSKQSSSLYNYKTKETSTKPEDGPKNAVIKAPDKEGTFVLKVRQTAYGKLDSDVKTFTYKVEIPVVKGRTYEVGGQKYKVTKAASGADGTVTFVKAKIAKSVVVPQSVKLADGKTYKVTAIGAKAFSGKKTRTVTVKTKNLKKSSVKKCLKGSKVKTVKVKVGSKKLNKKYVKKYKKIFTKKNAGRKVKVK